MGGDGDVKAWFKTAGFGEAKRSGGSLGGSGWSSTGKWVTEDREFFVKQSSKSCDAMFRGEAAGLTAMRLASEAGGGDDAPALKIPEVLQCSDYADGRGSYIVMEFLKMGGRGDPRDLGRGLARARRGQAMCHGQTDRQIDRQTDSLPRATHRYASRAA